MELRKDFRNTTALRGLSMTVGARRGLRVPGPKRGGQDHGGQAAARARPPDRRRGHGPRRAGRRPGDEAADRLPARAVPLPELADRPRGAGAALPAAATAPTGLATRGRRARCDTVGLADRGDDKVGTFSKGMQQRLGLGVALLGQPELVVLGRADERARPGRPPRRAR